MLVFVYGTLCEPIVRDRVLGRKVITEVASLPGYSKVCGGDYLTMVPSDGTVLGQVFDASDADLDRIDVWEEVPTYMRADVMPIVDGEPRHACAYIMPDPPDNVEVVGDDCIASIPLRDILREVGRMFDRRRAGAEWHVTP